LAQPLQLGGDNVIAFWF